MKHEDFYLGNHGSIVMLRPVTRAARRWASEHLPDDAQRMGINVAIEPRYVADIVAGIRDDGLSVFVL